MRDVAHEGEGEVSACGVAGEDDVLWEAVELVKDVVEEGGGLLQLARIAGHGGEVVGEEEDGDGFSLLGEVGL